jgi:hypothetical protein
VPAEEPTDWVHSWLKKEGLEKYSNGFIDNRIKSREDLLLGPALTGKELAEVQYCYYSVLLLCIGHVIGATVAILCVGATVAIL